MSVEAVKKCGKEPVDDEDSHTGPSSSKDTSDDSDEEKSLAKKEWWAANDKYNKLKKEIKKPRPVGSDTGAGPSGPSGHAEPLAEPPPLPPPVHPPPCPEAAAPAGTPPPPTPPAKPSAPRMVAKGYIQDELGFNLGRVFTPPFPGPNPSSHISCFDPRHEGRSRWAVLLHVPDILDCRRWIAMQTQFMTADAHLGAFNQVVYGNSTGPTSSSTTGGCKGKTGNGKARGGTAHNRNKSLDSFPAPLPPRNVYVT